MKTIYNEAIAAVEDGAKFRVDFEHRSLKINGKYIIKDGEYEGELGVDPFENMTTILSEIERLYEEYKNSIPSERSQNKIRVYFNALKENEIADEDMMYGEHREVAQIRLELYLLCCIINDTFQWSELPPYCSYYWQSKKDKNLIILRDWIEPKSE